MTKQQAKRTRQNQDREAFGVPPRMVRSEKRRARAKLENQPPMDGGRRLAAYEAQNRTQHSTHRLTPSQRRRFFKKAHAHHPAFERTAA